MRIIIGGDLVPTPSNQALFSEGRVRDLIGEGLESLFQSADYVCCNLEVPLTNTENPIHKSGPNLKAATSSAQGIRALGCNILTLANNHIMDQGSQGLNSTIKALDSAEVFHLGAGINLEAASEPILLEKDGVTVGIYACAEHEFSIATSTDSGANPFDPLESLDHIERLKHLCDYLIVIYHGGKEYYRYPTPWLQRVCRKMVEKGANLVITQHSHCVGCKEILESSTIVYGQGNFLFDLVENEYWNSGLLVQVDIDSEKSSVKFLPIVKNGCGVKLATSDEHELIITPFIERSNEILENGRVTALYLEYASKQLHGLLRDISGRVTKGVLVRALGKITSGLSTRLILKAMYSETERLRLINLFECEAWRELVIAGLKEELKL